MKKFLSIIGLFLLSTYGVVFAGPGLSPTPGGSSFLGSASVCVPPGSTAYFCNINVPGTSTLAVPVLGGTSITTTDAANEVTLTLDQQDTGTSNVLDITNAGTGNAITIDTSEFVVDSDGFLGFGTADPSYITHYVLPASQKIFIDAYTTPHLLGNDGVLDIIHYPNVSGASTIQISSTPQDTSGGFYTYGLDSRISDSAVITAGSPETISVYGYSEHAGADTSVGTITITGVEGTGSLTNSTDAGTRISYGGKFTAVGDTGGTSTSYGIYTTASGADTNYGIYSNAGINYFGGEVQTIGTITASEAIDITIADTVNNVGLTVTQNDTTNNPNAFEITNTGTGDSLVINTNEFSIASGGTVTMANDTWFRAIDNAGTGFTNMFKINTSDEIDVGASLNIGTMSLTEDSGLVSLVNLPVSATPADGDEESYSFGIDSNIVMKIKGSADHSGGADELQMIVAPTVGNLATFPSLAFGDKDTGFYESADDVLKWSIAGVEAGTLGTDITIADGREITGIEGTPNDCVTNAVTIDLATDAKGTVVADQAAAAACALTLSNGTAGEQLTIRLVYGGDTAWTMSAGTSFNGDNFDESTCQDFEATAADGDIMTIRGQMIDADTIEIYSCRFQDQ